MIFGIPLMFKWLYVIELRETLEKAKITPQELDSYLLKIDPKFCGIHSTQEILDDPNRLTLAYDQLLASLALSVVFDKDLCFQPSGVHLSNVVKLFLKGNPKFMLAVLEDFRSTCRVHVTTDIKAQVQDLIDGKEIYAASPNVIPPIEYAALHIIYKCWREVESK